MTNPDLIEDRLVEDLKLIPGIASVLDFEPQKLPRLPCVTMLLVRYDPDDTETGPGQDVHYEWRLRLYVSLTDYEKAQQSLKDYVPLILGAVRDDPRMNNLCDFARIRDRGMEPIFDANGAYLVKDLMFSAVLTER